MITSNQNQKIKWVRTLQNQARSRKDARQFVVEGVRLAEEALLAGWEAELVLYTSGLSERGQNTVQGYVQRGYLVEEVSESVMGAVSETKSPQGILVVVRQQTLPIPRALDFVLIADEIRDPGNLGSMLRSAAAAGVQLVWLTPGCTDPYAPKVLRSAMGAHFHLPLETLDWKTLQERVQQTGLHIYLAAADAGSAYTTSNFQSPLALIIGSEATGVGEEARLLAHDAVHIPMPGASESLNAAAATAILLFEVVRQRSGSNKP